VAQGVLGRLRPRIFLTFQHYKGGRSSATCTGCLYPRRNPWYSLSEAESTSWHMVLSGYKRKIPTDTARNRSRDHPIMHFELKLFCISTTVLTYYYYLVCIILSIMWNLYDGMPLVSGI